MYAVSKGRPTKEAVRLRLDCSAKIQADLECLREDYIVNKKAKLLVMVSMATDEMIRLVTMYPEVWFMDTTAGEFLYQFIRYEFININSLDMNSFIISNWLISFVDV